MCIEQSEPSIGIVSSRYVHHISACPSDIHWNSKMHWCDTFKYIEWNTSPSCFFNWTMENPTWDPCENIHTKSVYSIVYSKIRRFINVAFLSHCTERQMHFSTGEQFGNDAVCNQIGRSQLTVITAFAICVPLSESESGSECVFRWEKRVHPIWNIWICTINCL